MKGQILMDLEQTLTSLHRQWAEESVEIEERLQELTRKERQALARWKSLQKERETLQQDRPRRERRHIQRLVLAVRETLGRVAADLADASRGAWGDQLPLPTTFRRSGSGGTEMVVVLPVDPAVLRNWEAHAGTPPLRITLVVYAMLVNLATEYKAARMPEMDEWDRFLAMTLDLGIVDEQQLAELEAEDAALFLDEATPRPWAGGGREMTPTLVKIPAMVLGSLPADAAHDAPETRT